MKATSSSGPSREQIADVTGASQVLRDNIKDGRHRGRPDHDMLAMGGDENSALFNLLRQD